VRLSSARWPGSGAVRTSKRWPLGAPPCARSRAAHDVTAAGLVEAQQLAEAQLEAAAIRLATWSVGLVSPRSTWLSIGADTPERSARSRSERSIASRSARTRGPMWSSSPVPVPEAAGGRRHYKRTLSHTRRFWLPSRRCPTPTCPTSSCSRPGGVLGEAWMNGVLAASRTPRARPAARGELRRHLGGLDRGRAAGVGQRPRRPRERPPTAAAGERARERSSG
jgi:hypothetical protein